MGSLMRSFCWEATPLGAPHLWSQSLKTSVGILLENKFPMYIAWGEEFTQFNNDAYRPILGTTKHPSALGKSTRQTFAEIWHIIGPMFDDVVRGEAVGLENFMLPLNRHGFVEECYFTFSYSPVRNEIGDVGGVLVTVTETTTQVYGERRLRLLKKLGEQTGKSRNSEQACAAALNVLAENPSDLPWAALYRVDLTQKYAELLPHALSASLNILPARQTLLANAQQAQHNALPFSEIVNQGTGIKIDMNGFLQAAPQQLLNQPHPSRVSNSLYILPIRNSAQSNFDKIPFGFLVVGISPHIAFSADYEDFLKLVSDAIASQVSIANIEEIERKRILARVQTHLQMNKLRNEVEQQKSLLNSILQTAPVVVWAVNLEGNYTLFEGLPRGSSETSLNGLVGQSFFDRMEMTCPDAVVAVKKALAGESFTAEVEFQDHWFSSYYAPVYSANGDIVGMSSVSTDITAYKKVERERTLLLAREVAARKALQEREKYFHEMVDSSPAMFWVTDTEMKCSYLSKQWYDYTGGSPSTDLGLGWLEHVHPDDRPRTLETFQQAASTRSVFRSEYRLLHVDGSYRWSIDLGNPLIDSSGLFLGYVGIVLDNHDKKVSEKKVTDTLEEMSDAFFTVDKNWIITKVNAKHVELTKLKREDQLGKNILDLFFSLPSDQNSNYWTFYHEVMRTRQAAYFEDYYAPLKFWTAVNVYPDHEGGLAVFFRDITEQKRTSQKILIEKRKFESIFVDSPAAMALLKGPEFIFEKFNPKFEELMGFRELLGKPHAEAVPELKDQPFQKLLEEVFRTGKTHTGREVSATLHSRSNTETVENFFDFTYSRVDDGQGNPYGIYVHAINVTDKVIARQNVENLARVLEEAVRARDEFLFIASHELKTPLTSLKLQSQIFQRSVQKGDLRVYQKERIDDVISQTEKQVLRLTRLVDDMLDVSRIRSGKLTLELESFDLCALVQEVLNRMSLQLSAAGYAPPEFIPCAEAAGNWDRLRLEQVVANLLTNAIRYGRKNAIVLELVAKPDSVVLDVRDFGIGISQKAQQKIFDRFERAIDADEVSGLGLGLFITKQIVQAHGGTIQVHSEVSRGSTFRIELPRKPLCKEILENKDAE